MNAAQRASVAISEIKHEAPETVDTAQKAQACIAKYEKTPNEEHLQEAIRRTAALLSHLQSDPINLEIAKAALVTLLSYEPSHDELSDEEIEHIRQM